VQLPAQCVDNLLVEHVSVNSEVVSPETSSNDAQPPTSADFVSPRIAGIDRQIMLELIKLARFNLNFHRSLNQKTFYQEWLYPMFREAGTALSFSNTIVDITQRAEVLENPRQINRSALKRGVECALIGQAITGTSSGASLVTNLIQSSQARAAGYSPSRSIATVKGIVAGIDQLLAQRNRTMEEEHIDAQQHIYGLQGRMLEHLRNQLVFEFKTWSIQSRSTEWSEDTFYAIDSAQGFTQMASSCASLKAFSNSSVGGTAAITSLVANCMVTVNPLVRTAVGGAAANIQRKRLDREFPTPKPKSIDKVLAEEGESMAIAKKASATTKETEELAFLVRQSADFDVPLNQEVARFEKLRRIADQQAVSGPLIGLTGVIRGILNTTAHYYRVNHPDTPSAASSQSASTHTQFVVNDLNFAGRLVQSTGQVYSLILTPATEIRHFVYKRRLQRAGREPKQVLQARLNRLDELEVRIKAGKY
jgi:hypothetical protein